MAGTGGTGNVEVPASPEGMNVGQMKGKNECETRQRDQQILGYGSARDEHN
jgi:hypothetical protein